MRRRHGQPVERNMTEGREHIVNGRGRSAAASFRGARVEFEAAIKGRNVILRPSWGRDTLYPCRISKKDARKLCESAWFHGATLDVYHSVGDEPLAFLEVVQP